MQNLIDEPDLKLQKTMYDRDMVPMSNAQEVGYVELTPEAIDAIAEAVVHKMEERHDKDGIKEGREDIPPTNVQGHRAQ